MSEEGELYIAHRTTMADIDTRIAPAFAEAILRAYYSVATDDCKCSKNIEWTWAEEGRSDFVELMNDNVDVKFHQNYSGGTAVVKGTQPMSENQHYWEVKMTAPVYGTDIMIGVGTNDAEVSQVPDRFISLLGMDSKTWGYSYTGLFHHSGESHDYAPGFGQGSVIGVHLDLWNGTLSFYKNRKHLGIASTGLKGKTLYAMASSTAARSGMRIIRTCSFPSSLQYLCCSKLRELIPDDKRVLDVLDIPPGLCQYLENNLNWLLDQRLLEDSLNPCCKRKNGNKDKSLPEKIFDETCFGQVLAERLNSSSNQQSDNERNRRGSFMLVDSVPCLLHNCHTYQTSSTQPSAVDSDSSSNYLQPEPMEESGEDSNIQAELQQETSEESMEDNDDCVESSNKRQRFSYNYVMGLSDPDSD